ncbi:MAG: efflux RND transporter permease subunit [Candidatus Obscuribacterales bacterium]|jgi:multidrug efflux pump subunit AcrB|nr:efflux RND transporter permease subunit [Candidatus Obscuribacterales bacterium]
MSENLHDEEQIAKTKNMARYFVETRQVSWILLIITLLWGAFAYWAMDKRKDPLQSNLFACVVCPWPGASADKVEDLVTRKIEEKISENMKVQEITSVSRSNVSIITIKIDDRLKKTEQVFDDLNLRLSSIQDLPSGAGPIRFLKDYGEITTMMLTIASPKASEVEVSLRAREIEKAIENTREQFHQGYPQRQDDDIAIALCYPHTLSSTIPRRQRDKVSDYGAKHGLFSDVHPFEGNGFVGVIGKSKLGDQAIYDFLMKYVREKLKPSFQHPDLWDPIIVRDTAETKNKLMAAAGDKYSNKDLADYADLIKRSLQTLKEVTRITTHGVIGEQINLDFSQERLASYGMQPTDLREKLTSRNILGTGGMLEVAGRNLPVRPTGAFTSEKDIGSVVVSTTPTGVPVYLRDIVEISRDYESPPRFLGFLTWKDKNGKFQRSRAVTLAVFMRSEEQIDKFGVAVDQMMETLKSRLPDDLILERITDQPEQVRDNIELFMTSLYEAIGLVILTALIGFWEWRSALLIATSIPTTLAMTFGMMHILGLDLQQCSIAALIIALGLLVDDPVVAGDAIKRELGEGRSRLIASWLGPTKLAHAIMFATLTNIAAYLPLLMMTGEVGQFITSLPIVITCSLIASRIVSMTFVPFLGYYLLRPPKKKERSAAAERAYQTYMKIGGSVLKNRIPIFACSLVVLCAGFYAMSETKSSFFPNDVFKISWVDVWMPEDASITATNDAAEHVERVTQEVTKELSAKINRPDFLNVICTYVGGAGPRFWSSLMPELDQLNYSQVIIEVDQKHDTDLLVPALQKALDEKVPEARCDVRQLEGGKPVGLPIALRISGSDEDTLRELAKRAAEIIRACPMTARVRDDWGAANFGVDLRINPDKAFMSGLSNQDIADSSIVGLNGYRVDALREGDKQIPIVARLRLEESGEMQSLSDLYVYSVNSQQKLPLTEVATINFKNESEKIKRRNQFRTITVGAYTQAGYLPSEIMEQIRPEVEKFRAELPPGYKLEIGGEEEDQLKSFTEMAIVMAVSVVSIFICLVLQFKNAVKPFLVFAAIPYGMLGALVGLMIMDKPFGFPAFMGVASLAGVIVSHVIVLFDFIEASHEEGAPLKEALLHASMIRLRPVLITVSATVLGFVPLAMHGGPLWEPLCYAQIGGLTVATFVTLILVPIIYAIAVLDLKIVSWDGQK